ncbi:hypothetical protein CCP3SC1_930012 [Gammaproteobacteria bacterium]
MAQDRNRAIHQILVYGAISVTLYFSLYLFSGQILEFSRQGHWYFIVPIAIAFLFSFVHGHFTGQFWDILGIKAKQVKK